MAYLWLVLYQFMTIIISLTLQVLAFCIYIYIYFNCLLHLTLNFSNTEQSKHLETARMRLFDMWIDFVNLRSEEYSDNSRIPTKVYSCRTFCYDFLWLFEINQEIV